MLTAPLGISATEPMISLCRAAMRAPWAGIFTTAVQPAASAGASERIIR